MDTLLEAAKIVSLPGAILAFVIIVMRPLMPIIADWMKSKVGSATSKMLDGDGNIIDLASLDKKIALLGSNHFHEVKDQLTEIKMLLKEMNDRTLVILTKITNGHGR